MRGTTLRALTLAVVLTSVTVWSCGGGQPTQPTQNPAQPGAATSPAKYLQDLVDVMQANSVNRLTIDWTAFRGQVLAAAAGAQTIPDTYGAIRVALGLLGDHHSFYQKPNDTGIVNNPSSPSGCVVPTVASPAVPQDIGYVRVPACCTASQPDLAATLQGAIRSSDADGLAGWIVDLRGNTGGNMWPMLAGVGPVLGIGTAGWFLAPNGVKSLWGYDSRGSTLAGTVAAAVTNAYTLKRPGPRVAVLTDKAVASSGEAIAVAFRGRPNTRTLGTDTCGVPTANRGFNLSDGAVLFLTDAIDVDRTGAAYNAPLLPDEAIADPAQLLQRAIDWIRSGS